MQLSARILTALAVLAFVVGVAVGTKGATDDVSAATGTIDALNVGTCTTTNADAFDADLYDNADDGALSALCSQLDAFYQQDPLTDMIEVDTLYATYAHDPSTAAEAPRAILTDGDLLMISITDSARDRRDPVVITTAQTTLASPGNNGFIDNTDTPPITIFTLLPDTAPEDAVDDSFDAKAIVAEVVGVDDENLPALEQLVEFDGAVDLGDANNPSSTYMNSGTYEIIWERETVGEGDFKPIAPDGVVKFFGRIDDGLAADTGGGDDVTGFGPFQDLGSNITLDEDVISGEPDSPPVMTLNISVPDSAGANQGVQIQVIYYETSGIEFILGGEPCVDDPHLSDDAREFATAACTSDETEAEVYDSYVLHAESDEDAADDKKHLALQETGRFTGVFQGMLRLTDADGNGGAIDDEREQDPAVHENWGRAKTQGAYDVAAALDDRLTTAVLGVGNGPVEITYRDTDGQNRSYQIEIDILPPTITVDSPEHEGRSDDEKPAFIGTFNDSDSGLAANSFQLDVDNSNDPGDENTIIISVPAAVSSEGDEQVQRRQDYIGFGDDPLNVYGLIALDETVLTNGVYKVEDDPEDSDRAPAHYSLEADDFDDGAPDGEFNGELEIDFDEFLDATTDFDGFNNAVDFQALVRDLAGNVGFSDSDPTAPRFINALGEEEVDDRDPDGETHNVIGVYSRHVVYIDEIDPSIEMDASVTGFYGLDDDDIPVRDRSAVMVVFDNSVNDELIDTGTFSLQHDETTAIEIVDVDVEGRLVFLQLGEELASDATPTLAISEGREVQDLAGNLLTWQEEDAEPFMVQDGILPVFSVTLSGGSGTGVGSESPSRLTSAAMDIAIESDEDVNGSPKVSIVCSDIEWPDGDDTNALADFVSNRTGYDEMGNESTDMLRCGGDDNPEDFRESASLARPGNNWVYAWRNASDESPAQHLNDGNMVVVVWGRDRSTFDEHTADLCPGTECENWGSQTVEFTLDSILNSPLNADGSGGSVQPEADSEVKEPRPFVYLDFAGENTSVEVTELLVDGEDVLGELDSVGDNRFLYWPAKLEFGTHTVEFDARDAADNEPTGRKSFEFDVTARDPFVIDLTAGWNAISFPANPKVTALDAVFTEEAVDRVVGWNPLSSTGPWSIATRIDGVWTTSANFAPLTDIVVRYGYWVHSMAFTEQSVDLQGQLDRESGDNPTPVGIITVPGWNFVGVVDQDGDQTEDNFGDTLQDSEDADVNADDYMPGFRQAYTWDAIANGYRVLDGGDDMVIGKGIWVFFPDGDTVAP